MDASTETRKRGEKQHCLNLKATVNALLGMPYTHFPLLMPGVHRLVAPLVMFRLKRRGFSNCRVDVSGSGLIVYADR